MRLEFDVSGPELDKIRSAVLRLLEVNLLTRERSREAYAVVRRHREALEVYFRFLGWELVVDERHECIYLHVPQAALRRSLSREETVWMLVLRLIYQEKRQALSLAEYPSTTLYEIRSKYEAFRIPWINRSALDRLVRLCSRYELMDAIDDDWRSDECRFRLYHTWLYAVQADDVDRIAERIARFEAETEGGAADEMADAAAFD